MKAVIKASIGKPFLRTHFIMTTIALGLFALPQRTQAVTPPPDGSYPGFNTAEGQNALFSLTTGQWNTALGAFTLRSDTDGSYNTAVGTAALLFNVGSQNAGTGIENTAVGAAALLLNATGSSNTGLGADALLNNSASGNTAVGVSALQSNTEGSENTATGRNALINNTTGGSNTAMGVFALNNNIDGGVNTAIGIDALHNNNHGSNNTAIGHNALGGSVTGNFNIGLGSNAGTSVTSASNVICIGTEGNNVDNACYIGQIFGATSSGGTAVLINSNGRLGTMTSSRRLKEEIKPMGRASEALFALKPVAFRYKKDVDPQRIPQFGLVAEDVEAVNPDLVVRDKNGKPYSVRYDAVNAMLLNEFLKEHRNVEKLQNDFQNTVAQQQKEIRALTAQLKEQASQMQKVSAQVQTNKPAPQMVVNP